MTILTPSREGYPSKALSSDPEELQRVLNALVDSFISISTRISFDSNFNAYIAEVKIPASSSLKIQHFLGVKPKYRIILRQTGNGVITDNPLDWTDKVISLRNNGAEEVALTVLIARE